MRRLFYTFTFLMISKSWKCRELRLHKISLIGGIQWGIRRSPSFWFPEVDMYEKEEIWNSPMTKALTPTETPISQATAQRHHRYHLLRLHNDCGPTYGRMVSWSNDSHPTSVVKSVYGIQTFQLTPKFISCVIKKTHIYKFVEKSTLLTTVISKARTFSKIAKRINGTY